MNLVEGAVLRIGDGEVGAEQLRPRAEIHDAAIGVEAAADAGAPAIAEIDRAGEPDSSAGHGRGRVGLASGGRRRGGPALGSAAAEAAGGCVRAG